jgi:hypothetical protein
LQRITVENPTTLYLTYLPAFVIPAVDSPEVAVVKYYEEKRALQ